MLFFLDAFSFWRQSSFSCLLVSFPSFIPFSWLAEAAGNDRSVWSYLTRRAVVMASIDEPNEGDIQNFISFTGAPQSRAIQYLKVGMKGKPSCNSHTDVDQGSQ